MEHEVETYEVDAVQYLIKPVSQERLCAAVDRAMEELSLPDTLEVVVTEQSSEDTAEQPGDDGKRISGKMTARSRTRTRPTRGIRTTVPGRRKKESCPIANRKIRKKTMIRTSVSEECNSR